MPTLRELAQAIGVSPTTVSRAMHGRGRISDATRQKVLQRIQEAGYTPNVHAQRLKVGRTQMIALDFGYWSDVLSDMFFVELTRGIQDALEERGYGLLLTTRKTALQQWVNSRAVDGVILVTGGPRKESMPREIAASGTPCVVIGHEALTGIAGVGTVVVGLQNGAQQVARLLVEYGHRRISYLGSGEEGDMVLAAFREELERLGRSLPSELIRIVGYTPQSGADGMRALLALPDPPTAVFARTDALAAGALQAARLQGIPVPEELSIVGHDDVPFASLAEPPLTTVRVNCLELGKLATEMLFALIEQPEISPEPRVVQTELVMRETVAVPLSPG
ncbi:MAG TPA: LacI family DNA-binding transcriptional regulator [Chthonomonadaceae bacterium]|nr:LacI family DNA-binding transcriptional regulator [Chthonomonadaceae bacterium]